MPSWRPKPTEDPFDYPKITREWLDLRAQTASGFRVITADPNWSFENYSAQGAAKNPNQHYKVATPEQIAELPVSMLAAENCALFMWVTWPMMPKWNMVIERWGFEYKGLAWEWIKHNPATGAYSFGPGYGTRKNLEPCLLATRGKPAMRKSIESFFGTETMTGSHSVRDFIIDTEVIASPLRQHSRKPAEARIRIETMFEGPYIELFARHARKGWSAWGDEVGMFEEG